MSTRLLIALTMLSACDFDSVSTPSDTGTATEPEPAVAAVCTVIPDGGPATCPTESSPIPYRMIGPNVHLVVDRSGSMSGTKWQELQSLTAFLPMVGARANLGLSLFSDPSSSESRWCGTDESEVVPLSEGHAAAAEIEDWLMTTSPSGKTPIADTLDRLDGAPGLQCPNRDNIVVLLSDGEESCGGDPVAATRRLVGQDQPVELYVIGFATNSQANRSLQKIADAAAPTTGPDNFYTASTADELVARLAAVTATCTAQMDAPFDADTLQVTLDGTPLTECATDHCESGYTIDEQYGNVRIEGTDCLATLDGECHDLQFAEGL